MKSFEWKTFISVLCLLVYQHYNIFSLIDCAETEVDIYSSQFPKLTPEETRCLRGIYKNIKDLYVHQPSLFAEGISYCKENWTDKGSECQSTSQCACRANYMNCGARRLKSFPRKIDQGITWLNLRDNLLGGDVTMMTFNDYSQLLYLDLSHNLVRTLKPFTFQYLKRLTMLTMAHMEILEINKDAFYDLTDLVVLDLSNNNLTILTWNSFDNLSKLNMLCLRDNKITTIENSAFDGLANLKVLDLEKNYLKSLSSENFQGLHALEVLYAQRNYIENIRFDTGEPMSLRILDLRENLLPEVTPGTFKMLSELKHLNLENNKIVIIAYNAFSATSKLEKLILRGNSISQVFMKMFEDADQLQFLDLGSNHIQTIELRAFQNLVNLSALDLSDNKMTRLRSETFTGLNKLRSLSLENNPIREVGRRVFKATPNLWFLHTDEFRFCCLAPHVPSCSPMPDQFSSCHDLMTNIVLRICIWALGVIAVISNIFVIVFRTVNKNANPSHSFLIKNLAMSDLFMGVYLLTIASVDTYYRGVYGFYDFDWKTSKLCNFAGFMSTFSSELSVFTLTVITLDRYFAVAYPFCVQRQEMKRTRLLMLTGWIFALIIAIIPLPIFNIAYFSNFYGRSGVCLPLHITKDKVHGWEYSVSVFIVLNTISFAIITTCYVAIYWITKKTRQNVQPHGENRAQQRQQNAMAFRMTLLVSADAACWMPIIGLGLLSVAGCDSLSPNVYAWIAVFVLPLNAALNPILYTISLIPLHVNWKREDIQKYLKFWNKSSCRSSRPDSTTKSNDNYRERRLQD